MLVLVTDMIFPGLFRPIARLWIGISYMVGSVVSRIVLTMVFFILVTPVGVIRQLLGFDPLRLKEWKTGSGSTFKDREHLYQRKDLERPY